MTGVAGQAAVLFDIDGTLADIDALHLEVFQPSLRRWARLRSTGYAKELHALQALPQSS
jgi:beta-phosphoglucomutase-like phosphatase (HAD superfamily)